MDENINNICKNSLKYSYYNISKVLAIGDIHGDIKLLKNILKKNNIITKIQQNSNEFVLIDNIKYYVPIQKNYIVIQVGDQLDGYRPGSSNEIDQNFKNDDIEVYKLMDKLFQITDNYNKTYNCNYHIISLIGNHEIMNIIGQYNYAVKNSTQKNNKNREKIIYNNNIINSMLCFRAFVVTVNDKLLFSHAGLVVRYIKNIMTPEIYNLFVNTTSFNEKFKIFNIYCLNFLHTLTKNNKLSKKYKFTHNDKKIYDLVGHREFNINNKKLCNEANKTINDLKLNHLDNMIIGHNIVNNINTRKCNKINITNIDVGASRAFEQYSTFYNTKIPKAILFTFNSNNKYTTQNIMVIETN